MRRTLENSPERPAALATRTARGAEHGKAARIPVLHLMNAVADSSITRIVADQLNHFDDRKYEWHIGGLKGIEEIQPFSPMNAKLVDFSKMAKGRFQLAKVIRAYVKDHGIRLIHTHTPRTTVTAALALGMDRRAKLLTTKHLHVVAAERRTWGWLVTLVDRFANHTSDQLVAVSNDVGEKIKASFGVRRDRVTVIQNAVDIQAYCVPEQRAPCRLEFGIPADSPVLGFAGRITKQKRVDLLLEAFATVLKRYPAAYLVIAGEGDEQEEQERYAQQLGLGERVIWAGHRRDIPRILAAIDIYVQSSVNEGLSLSLLQAMAARKAVVATDVGGTREIVNERTGSLVSAGSSAPIAEAIIQQLDHPEQTATLIRNARRLVDEHFSVQRQMEGYREVYERLLSAESAEDSTAQRELPCSSVTAGRLLESER